MEDESTFQTPILFDENEFYQIRSEGLSYEKFTQFVSSKMSIYFEKICDLDFALQSQVAEMNELERKYSTLSEENDEQLTLIGNLQKDSLQHSLFSFISIFFF